LAKQKCFLILRKASCLENYVVFLCVYIFTDKGTVEDVATNTVTHINQYGKKRHTHKKSIQQEHTTNTVWHASKIYSTIGKVDQCRPFIFHFPIDFNYGIKMYYTCFKILCHKCMLRALQKHISNNSIFKICA